MIKQLLREALPGLRVFLDVDDLEDISNLEGYIAATDTVLVFISQGYFSSKNCMRELEATVQQGKRLILVRETELAKGGLTLENAIQVLY